MKWACPNMFPFFNIWDMRLFQAYLTVFLYMRSLLFCYELEYHIYHNHGIYHTCQIYHHTQQRYTHHIYQPYRIYHVHHTPNFRLESCHDRQHSTKIYEFIQYLFGTLFSSSLNDLPVDQWWQVTATGPPHSSCSTCRPFWHSVLAIQRPVAVKGLKDDPNRYFSSNDDVT